MTTTITINHQNGALQFTEVIVCSHEAEKLARFKFNPSGRMNVNRLKALAAAFISECRALQETMPDPQAKREAAIAITDMQKTVMMAVMIRALAAATSDL